jgi:hypothetical protein
MNKKSNKNPNQFIPSFPSLDTQLSIIFYF